MPEGRSVLPGVPLCGPGQRLDAQRQKVAELAARHAKLAASKGMEAGATTRAAEALARAQIQEQRMLQAALKTSEAMERQNTEILKFTDRMGGASSAVEQTARKQKQHTKEVERTSRASGKLLKATTLIAAAAGAARLAKSFLDFSDTQAQITARLNLMNDGLQETSALNEMIFQSSLRSRLPTWIRRTPSQKWESTREMRFLPIRS